MRMEEDIFTISAKSIVSDIRSLGTEEARNTAEIANLYLGLCDKTLSKESIEARQTELLALAMDSSFVYSGMAETLYEYVFDTILPKYTPLFEDEIISKTVVQEEQQEPSIYSIYPNPTSDYINIELADNILDDDIIEFLNHYGMEDIEDCATIIVNIYDVNSRLISTGKYKYDTLISIDVREFTAGTYMVEISSCYERVMQTKIVKL